MELTKFIKKTKYPLEYIALTCGVSVQTVRTWENGATSPKLLSALRLHDLSEGRVGFTEMLSKDETKKIKRLENGY